MCAFCWFILRNVYQISWLKNREVQLYTFLGLGAKPDRWSTPRPGRFTPGKIPVPKVQDAG